MSLRKLTSLILVLTLIGALNPTNAVADTDKIRKVIKPTEYGYAQANVILKSSPMVYVSGQVGLSKSGPNDFYSQVDRAFDNLEAVLKESGASTKGVVKITLLIVDYDPEKLAYMVKKRKSFFRDSYPASTLIPVARLYTDGVKFEIDAIALLPK